MQRPAFVLEPHFRAGVFFEVDTAESTGILYLNLKDITGTAISNVQLVVAFFGKLIFVGNSITFVRVPIRY